MSDTAIPYYPRGLTFEDAWASLKESERLMTKNAEELAPGVDQNASYLSIASVMAQSLFATARATYAAIAAQLMQLQLHKLGACIRPGCIGIHHTSCQIAQKPLKSPKSLDFVDGKAYITTKRVIL